VGLVVNEIVSSAKAQAEPEKVRARIESMAAGYAEPQQVINWYYSNQAQLQQIEMAVLEDRWSITSSGRRKVEDAQASYQDVDRRQGGQNQRPAAGAGA
jgi:trigger factor